MACYTSSIFRVILKAFQTKDATNPRFPHSQSKHNTEQDETPGLGQKALDESFTGQYLKAIPENGFEVTKNGATQDNQIDAIGGATITSNAVTNSVNQAITIFNTLTGGAN